MLFRSLDELQGKPVLAVCGIGNPKAFLKSLESIGVNLVDSIQFPDHHPYTTTDIAQIIERAQRCSPRPEAIVCTGKDLAKLASPTLGSTPLWALQIDLQLANGEDILNDYLDRLFVSRT